VEDNPTDVILFQEALNENSLEIDLAVVDNGEDALKYLKQENPFLEVPRPDMILLDLNLPILSGIEVLREIKSDDILHVIPVVILTSSKADGDIKQCYDLHANCYIVKPIDFFQFSDAIKNFRQFWFSVATLPT
jgi:CheY-like chemotaxis protein